MAEIVETVKIDSPDAPGGHTVINKSDFDSKTQKLWVEPKAEVKPKA